MSRSRKHQLPETPADLQLSTDTASVRREWRFQRATWVVALLVLVAAVLGVFGNGPLSSASSSSGDGLLTVGYQRFERLMGNSEAEFRVGPAATADGAVRLVLAGPWIRTLDVQQLLPQPSTSWSDGEDLVLEYEVEAGEPLVVTMEYRAADIGPHSGEVTLEPAGVSAGVWQLVYP